MTFIRDFLSSFSTVTTVVSFHFTSKFLSFAKLYHLFVFSSIREYSPVRILLIVIFPSLSVLYLPITLFSSFEYKLNKVPSIAILLLSLSTLYIVKFPFLCSFSNSIFTLSLYSSFTYVDSLFITYSSLLSSSVAMIVPCLKFSIFISPFSSVIYSPILVPSSYLSSNFTLDNFSFVSLSTFINLILDLYAFICKFVLSTISEYESTIIA